MESNLKVITVQSLDYVEDIFVQVFGELIFILPIALLASLTAFFVAIIVLYLLRRKKTFVRKNRTWDILAKLHYPIWLVAFMCVGFLYGTVNAVESRVENALEKTVKPFVEDSVPIVYEYLVNELPVLAPDEKITIRAATAHIMENIIYEPRSEGYFEKLKADTINYVILGAGEWVMTYIVNALVTHLIQSAGQTLHFSEGELEFNQLSIADVSLENADTTIAKVASKAIKNQVENFFNLMYGKINSIFLFLILILLIEPLMYHLWWKKCNPPES